MRRVRLDRAASPGAALAQDVIGPAGQVAAPAGHQLAHRSVQALAARGISWCYVEDRAGAGLRLTPLDADDGGARALPAFVALPEAAAGLARSAAAVDPQGWYVTMRQAAGDDAGHAVVVAALTARIGALIGFDKPGVVDATTAALLHDTGLVFVPEAVRRAPASGWRPPERRRYEDHAAFGEALLEPLADPSLHLAIVAAEHHEAQDASGFPRRIGGGNRVLRTAEEKRDGDRLALLSEVVAVADRYERLLSPAPGYGGRSAAAARLVLEAEAGSLLNREIVMRFLASFPALPLGTEVRVVHGQHHGAHGIVYALSRRDPARPFVRLYADATWRPIEPVKIELAREPATVVVPVDDAA